MEPRMRVETGRTAKLQAGTYLYVPLVSDLTREGMTESWRGETPEVLEPLTERELQILRLMAGIGNREIAAALELSEGTVKIMCRASSRSSPSPTVRRPSCAR